MIHWVTCLAFYVSDCMSNLRFIDELSLLATLHYPCVQTNMISITSLHSQNMISLSLIIQHHPLDTQCRMPIMFAFSGSRTQIEDLIFPSVFSHSTPAWAETSQKPVSSSRHYSKEGRRWWYRIKNFCAAVAPRDSISQLDAIPQL